MALRKLQSQLNPVQCTIVEGVDYEITKPDLALTPSAIKELTDRGIAVNLPNEKQFLQGSPDASWEIDPVFRRDADMCQLWELEQVSQKKVIKAHKVDKQKFG